jgi:sensor histidine kinase YesM
MFSLSTSYLVQQIWIESPFMFNLSVLHVWFKIFRWNHPVYSTCLFFIQTWSTDKLNIQGDSIHVLNQTWNTDKLNIQGGSIQKFWTRHEVLTSWTYRVIHVWLKTWMESPCMFFMSGSKRLGVIFLYVQFVSTSCLAQNFWIEPPCMFNLSVFHVWFKTWMESSWTYRVIQSKIFQPDMK